MPARPFRARFAVTALATAALALPLVAAQGAPATAAPLVVTAGDRGDDGDGKAARAARTERRATSAVGRARAIAEGRSRGDLTMALRDVANTRAALRGAEREAAEALLRRPTDSEGDGTLDYGGVAEATPVCSVDVCVHYVTSGTHAATPTYAQTVLETTTTVHDDYLDAGYREPLPDGTFGGDARIDVYLGNLGVSGLYGYCSSDQPETDPTPDRWDRWAYCALDNDYSATEFPTNTPLENLQVTVAHEYFHATQYAYDRYEDAWLLEATAAWVEDEMYDAVDDNLQYLATSQMTRPRLPLDTYDADTGFHYGTWSFFRLLTEKYPQRVGRLPRLVLDVFRKADGALGAADQYSWQAVDTVLRAKGTTAAAMLGTYAVANRRPGVAYDEGRANRYPTAPLLRRAALTPRRPRTAVTVRLDHLTTATTRLTPSGLAGTRWGLRLAFDLAPRQRGSSALVTTATRSGAVSTSRVTLDARGDGSKRVPFASSKVAWVEVTVVNGSGRFQCFTGQDDSCFGTALDDGQRMAFTATASR